MGNICSGESPSQTVKELSQLQLKYHQASNLQKRITYSSRFNRDVEKLKSNSLDPNIFTLILPVLDQRNENKYFECRILFSDADMQLYEGNQFQLMDMERFPIVDVFEDKKQPYLRQVYHKINTKHKQLPARKSKRNQNGQKKVLKYYNFRHFNSYELKQALYEIHLYKLLSQKHSSTLCYLEDFFILHPPNKPLKQLVIVFPHTYLMSLHDILNFRSLANYRWQDKEVALIAKMILESYLKLNRLGIVHRDIRPSKIFFKQLLQVNGSQTPENFYELANLESARLFEQLDDEDPDNDSDTLTVKGVPSFVSPEVRQALLQGDSLMTYNPFIADIEGIRNTLLAMITLDPINIQKTKDTRDLKKKSFVHEFDEYIQSYTEDSDKIPELTVQRLLNFVKQFLGSKLDSYQKSLYEKDLTIAQNLELNLYFQSEETKQEIQVQLYSKALFELQKKDIFVNKMMQQLKQNYQQDNKEANIKVLRKIGRYFEENSSSSLKDNQYYKEAIRLLIQLATDYRLCGFFQDHTKFYQEAVQIFSSFDQSFRTNMDLKSLITREKAYKYLNDIKLKEEQTEEDQLQQIRASIIKTIDQAIAIGQKSSMPIQQQLQLIYSKGQILSSLGRTQQAQVLVEKGLIISRNSKNFPNKHTFNIYKSKFQLFEALILLEQLKNSHELVKKNKIIFKLQTQLAHIKERFGMVNVLNLIFVIRTYVALGDLEVVKEDIDAAKNMYQKALGLVHVENQKFVQNKLKDGRAIAAAIELDIVKKILQLNCSEDQAKYEKLKEQLKKQIRKPRKQQKRYNRAGRQQKLENQTSTKVSLREVKPHKSKPLRRQRQDLPSIEEKSEDIGDSRFQNNKQINELPQEQEQSQKSKKSQKMNREEGSED